MKDYEFAKPAKKTRAYFFGNMYLSPIQQGIQALHVTSNMFLLASFSGMDCPKKRLLYKWANSDKTVELRNGGYQSNLKKIAEALHHINDFYPDFEMFYSAFKEEDDALNGALTSVGFVIEEIDASEVPENMQEINMDNVFEKTATVRQLLAAIVKMHKFA